MAAQLALPAHLLFMAPGRVHKLSYLQHREERLATDLALTAHLLLQAPGSIHKLNYLQHREEKVAADLALIAGLLDTSRQNGTMGDMGASYNTPALAKTEGKEMTAKMATTSRLKHMSRTKCELYAEFQAFDANDGYVCLPSFEFACCIV